MTTNSTDKDEFLRIRLDSQSAKILNILARRSYRSKAMVVRFLIAAAGQALERKEIDTSKVSIGGEDE